MSNNMEDRIMEGTTVSKDEYISADKGKIITNVDHRTANPDVGFGSTKINGHDFLVVDYKGTRYFFYDDSPVRKFTVSEVFCLEIYKDLDVKGKNVIDIGCGCGDSGIFFLINGAKHIFGFDIVKSYLEACNLNIINNHMEGKFDLCQPNTDIATSLGSINRFIDRASSELTEGIPKVLKIDAEGVEYFMLLGSKISDILIYDSIIVEIHGETELIEKILAPYYNSRIIDRVRVTPNRDVVEEVYTTILFEKK